MHVSLQFISVIAMLNEIIPLLDLRGRVLVSPSTAVQAGVCREGTVNTMVC